MTDKIIIEDCRPILPELTPEALNILKQWAEEKPARRTFKVEYNPTNYGGNNSGAFCFDYDLLYGAMVPFGQIPELAELQQLNKRQQLAKLRRELEGEIA